MPGGGDGRVPAHRRACSRRRARISGACPHRSALPHQHRLVRPRSGSAADHADRYRVDNGRVGSRPDQAPGPAPPPDHARLSRRRPVGPLARALIRFPGRHHVRVHDGDRRRPCRCAGLVDGGLRRPAPGRSPPAEGDAPDPGRHEPGWRRDGPRIPAGSGHRQRATPIRSGDPEAAVSARASGRGPPVPQTPGPGPPSGRDTG